MKLFIIFNIILLIIIIIILLLVKKKNNIISKKYLIFLIIFFIIIIILFSIYEEKIFNKNNINKTKKIFGGNNNIIEDKDINIPSLLLSYIFNIEEIDKYNNNFSIFKGINFNKLPWLSKKFIINTKDIISNNLKKYKLKLIEKKNFYQIININNKIINPSNYSVIINNILNEFNNTYYYNNFLNIEKNIINECFNILKNTTDNLHNINKKNIIKILNNINKKIIWKPHNSYTWAIQYENLLNDIKIILNYPDFINKKNSLENKWKKVILSEFNRTKWDYSFRIEAILCHEIWHLLQFKNLNNLIKYENRSSGPNAEWEPSAGNFIIWFEILKKKFNNNPKKIKIKLYHFLLYHYSLIKKLKYNIDNDMLNSINKWNDTFGKYYDNNVMNAVSLVKNKKANTYAKHLVAFEYMNNIINDKAINLFWYSFINDFFLTHKAKKKYLSFDKFWDNINIPHNITKILL